MRFLVMMCLFPSIEKWTGKKPVPGLLLFLVNQVGFEVGGTWSLLDPELGFPE